MRRMVFLLTMMVAVILLASGVAFTQTRPEERAVPAGTASVEGEVVPDEYIVVLEDGALGEDEKPAKVAHSDEAQHPGLEVKRVYGTAVEGYAAEIPKDEVADVENDAGVLFVSPNRRYERAAVPPLSLIRNPAIDRVEADKSSTKSGNGSGTVDVDVAVIDDGIDVQHRELNVVGGKNCASGSGYDQDAGDVGHGTGVAGLIGARDDASGLEGDGTVGVAPGARLYALDVFDGFYATDGAILCAIDWVTARADKIEVANMSLGGPGSDDGACGIRNREAFHYAICRSVRKGVTYVAAAGNKGVNFSRNHSVAGVPESYDEVLAVTAMYDLDGRPGGLYHDDVVTSFSNYTTVGSPDAKHTIAAPGAYIYTTAPGNDYTFWHGTSFSAPVVAGAAALYKSRHPDATPGRVMEQLRTEAREQPRYYGFQGDPHRPIGNRYYGYLLYVGDL